MAGKFPRGYKKIYIQSGEDHICYLAFNGEEIPNTRCVTQNKISAGSKFGRLMKDFQFDKVEQKTGNDTNEDDKEIVSESSESVSEDEEATDIATPPSEEQGKYTGNVETLPNKAVLKWVIDRTIKEVKNGDFTFVVIASSWAPTLEMIRIKNQISYPVDFDRENKIVYVGKPLDRGVYQNSWDNHFAHIQHFIMSNWEDIKNQNYTNEIDYVSDKKAYPKKATFLWKFMSHKILLLEK